MDPLLDPSVKKDASFFCAGRIGTSMAISWREAKDCAAREGLPQVYHDCDTDVFGACRPGEMQGSFSEGIFIGHRCICMPALLTVEELEAKEKKFLEDNPDW
jgi:hypothetical protein